MKAQVLAWYISLVVLVVAGIGAFGMLGPWMVGQPDSLTVLLGALVYVVGIPVVGFAIWKLAETIISYSTITKEVK